MKFFIIFLIICGFYLLIESTTLECEYKGSRKYGCVVKNLQISSKDDRTIVDLINGHKNGKSNDDVKFFGCYNKIVQFFPLNLNNFFKNLENVNIYNTTLKEIHRSDLEQFGEKLQYLWLQNNEIQVLEGNLFQNNPNLEYINVENNQIKHIVDGIFKNLPKLHQLHFEGNLCIDQGANNIHQISGIISDAETKCKDYPLILRKLQDIKAKIDEFNERYNRLEGRNP